MPSRVEIDMPDDGGNKSVLSKLSQPQFDGVDFLNDILPVLNFSSQTQNSKTSRSTQIQAATTDSLALISNLNAVNVRSSSELTALTDEIVRSGNRLAYEVEVLRGDANGFHELLSETLKDEIGQFIKDGFTTHETMPTRSGVDGDENVRPLVSNDEPDFMSRLRLLGKMKARLDTVITIFGEAMKWPVPPSEVSGASLISVSAPELGIQSSEEDDKAREVLKAIRGEISDLLGLEATGYAGLEAASRKVEEYRQLAMVWKGTGEEKARLKFVESLAKLVDERKKALDAREASRNIKSDSSARSSSAMGRNVRGANENSGAAGLFRNLQRLKDDLYLE